jgi:TPR repeat protein
MPTPKRLRSPPPDPAPDGGVGLFAVIATAREAWSALEEKLEDAREDARAAEEALDATKAALASKTEEYDALYAARVPPFNPNEQLASVLLSNVHDLKTRLALSQVNKTFLAASKQDASLPGPEVLCEFAEVCFHTRERDKEKYFYLKAAAQGHAEAQETVGVMCFNDDEYATAVFWFQMAASQGNGYALNMLGYCYRDGLGVEKDPSKAVALWEKGVTTHGSVDCMTRLGFCYQHGWGVEQDEAKALMWYRKANAGGCSDAAQVLRDHFDY